VDLDSRTISLQTFTAVAFSTFLAAAEPVAPVVVNHGGKPAFRLTLPAGWDAIQAEHKTVIHPGAKHPHIQVWATTAKDLVSATASVGTLVESEVTHFVPAATTAAVIAGAPAVVLVGSGEEADDGDPSAAEVTLFTVQGVVYVLVNHAEGDGAAKHHDVVAGLLEMLRPGL
jgi:hypothetical protein